MTEADANSAVISLLEKMSQGGGADIKIRPSFEQWLADGGRLFIGGDRDELMVKKAKLRVGREVEALRLA